MTSARVLRFQSRWGFWKGLEPNILGSSRLPSFFFQITLKCKTRCVKVWMDHRTASATGLPLLLTHFLSKCSFFSFFFFVTLSLIQATTVHRVFAFAHIYTRTLYIQKLPYVNTFCEWVNFFRGNASLVCSVSSWLWLLIWFWWYFTFLWIRTCATVVIVYSTMQISATTLSLLFGKRMWSIKQRKQGEKFSCSE